MQEIIKTGKTVEEAVEAACAELKLTRDEVSVEVIEMPQRRLFSSVPAKVRVYVSDDVFSVKDLLGTQEEKSEETSAKAEIKTVSERAAENRPAQTKGADVPEVPAAAENAQSPAVPPESVSEAKKEIPEGELPESARAALDYLKGIAAAMNMDKIEFRAVEYDGGVRFLADGDDAASLIGRRGETMDALQYLCLLVSNHAGKDYCKISLDVADYRGKRERTLRALAKRVAQKVLKSRRSQTLDPMNPYERRVIHSTVQEINGVKSESVGDDPYRKVVIFPEGDRPRPYRGRDDRGRRDDFSRGRSPRRDAPRPSGGPRPPNDAPPAPPKAQAPELEKNLYGKIDL